jgi:hypothetical protein
MTYNVRRLITEAYYLTGIVSREFQTIQGGQLATGLSLLNDFLAFESIATQTIPYWQEYNFNTVLGQEIYFVPYLVDIESMCFYLSNVRIPMEQKSRKEYFFSGRVEGLTVMPFTFRMERTTGGANLWLYPLSNTPYPVMAMVKFGLDALPEQSSSYDMNLSPIYDRFYLMYMRYALAELICHDANVNVPPLVTAKLTQIVEGLIEVEYPDMKCSVISTLGECPNDLVSDVVKTSILGGYTP